MGLRTVPIKTYKQFLKSQRLEFKRMGKCHELWDLPDESLSRPVTIRCKGKEVPLLHIHTNCITMGLTLKDFKNWLN